MYHFKYINKKALKKISKFALIATSSTLLLLSGCNKQIKDDDDLGVKIMHAGHLANPLNEGIVDMRYSDITDEDLLKLPDNIDHLELEHCYFLHNLDKLPELCPNIKVLRICHCPSVIDLSFIYNLPNLELLELDECPGVSQELKDYLVSHNISNNISKEDIESANRINEIYNQIIKEDMTDEEKIKAITLYMIDNYEYDEEYTIEANLNPLALMTTDSKTVCAGYAYLADVLLCKANINSYYVVDHDHAWNMIECDDKYYYLDITTLDNSDYKRDIEKFDSAPFYLSSPDKTTGSTMTPYNAGDNKIIMPKEFVADIEAGEDLKTLKEKYGGDFTVYWLKIFIPILTVLGLASGVIYHQTKSIIKEHKLEIIENFIINKKRF